MEILLVALCYRNRDKLQPGGPLGPNEDLTFSWVCPVTDHEFRHNIVKVAVDPRGDSLVDLQTTLTMLGRNSLSITRQTH